MRLENTLPFAAERFGVKDENGVNLLLVVIKGTFEFDDNGKVEIKEKQEPVEMADQYFGETEVSSIKYASDFSFDKVATDIALIGNAYAPRGYAKESLVLLQVGTLQYKAKVFGDRQWINTVGIAKMSTPKPFKKISLIYENSFGGTDLSHPKSKRREAETRNPVGIGFRAKRTKLPVNGLRLPNLEDPNHLIKSPGDRPTPAGFGFIGPGWQPRASYAGTYDDNWKKNRFPLLPEDFDKRSFNAASPGLIYKGFLQGKEPVKIFGVSPRGPIQFSLPEEKPTCFVEYRDTESRQIDMIIDKLVIYSDLNQFIIVWNGCLRIHGEFHDIESIRCEQNI